jgi:hypothetical protein
METSRICWDYIDGDRIFSRAGSIKGFSLMLKVSHKHGLRDLTQIK